MEKLNALPLTAYCFELLLEALFNKLEQQHPNILQTGVSQMYGFGSYDTRLPSLKAELEKLAGSFINGKYLYDKKRELQSGKPIIKLNRPYKYLLFEYLNYDGVQDFIHKNIQEEKEKQEQLQLILAPKKKENHYYVSYHFGEYREIVKAQLIVKDNWKSVEYKYIYPQEDGSFKTFLYYGTVIKRADALHIQTRTLMDGKMVTGGENILYIGYGDPAKSKFILGVFSAFDINNRLIACKIIHEKCSSFEEMEALSYEKKIPAYIVQEIRNQRLENDINIPNDKLEISNKSPYYLTYEKIAGDYSFSFKAIDERLSAINISIDPDTYKIKSLIPGVLINKDEIELLHNGSVLHFSFKLTGLASFLQLDIYVKTYYLNKGIDNIQGVFSGIDFENRLLSGELKINFSPAN